MHSTLSQAPCHILNISWFWSPSGLVAVKNLNYLDVVHEVYILSLNCWFLKRMSEGWRPGEYSSLVILGVKQNSPKFWLKTSPSNKRAHEMVDIRSDTAQDRLCVFRKTPASTMLDLEMFPIFLLNFLAFELAQVRSSPSLSRRFLECDMLVHFFHVYLP